MVGRLIIAPVNHHIPQCAIILLPWLFLITYDTTFRPNCLSERSKELQSLLGKLSFVTACIRASRSFLSRFLSTLCSSPSNAKSQLATLEMRHDLAWWQTFLPLYNGVSVIKPPNWSFADFRFTMDACLTHGEATYLDKHLTFPFLDFVLRAVSYISALELFTVNVTLKFWATPLQHQRFLVSCDNEAAVTVIKSGSTKDPFMQRCLRQLWFTSALHDVDLLVRHIPGKHNTLANALSRWDNCLKLSSPK